LDSVNVTFSDFGEAITSDSEIISIEDDLLNEAISNLTEIVRMATSSAPEMVEKENISTLIVFNYF
jgi:hypothetical protein